MREASDREALWHALRSGVIDMIATDHAPHTAEVRTRLPIWRANCGFPGVERQMPLMLTKVARGRLAIEPYVRIAAEAPAKAFGLWPTRGRVAPGAHAHIAVVDPPRTEVIRAAA
ncbi:MAG: dihydroorotase family protein, partial [Elioraea sp.]|nr:dihydroorotase family protein [Elioraea sp.]